MDARTLLGVVFICATGNKKVITVEHMLKIRPGHPGQCGISTQRSDMEGLEAAAVEKKERART